MRMLFGHIWASAQLGPNSQNAEKECFWAPSGFRPTWSKPGATHPPTHPGATHRHSHPGATHPPTHPGATHPPGRHPPTHPPGRHPSTRAPPTLPPTRAPPTHPPTRAPPIHPGSTHPPTHPGATHPPVRHPPTHPPGRHPSSRAPATHPPTRAQPIEEPDCRKRMFLGTFRLQPNLVRTPGMPKRNVFGHIRASAQLGPNSQNAEYEYFWARSGFSPIWAKQQECRIRMFLGAFWLQPNLVRIARMPNTNVFGHIRVSGQFGPNSQNAEKECFWAHSGFRPIWSKPGATHPPTHPPGRHPSTRALATYPPTRAPPTHPPTWAPPTHPPTHPGSTHRRARLPKTNVFGHIQASAQFGPNTRNAEKECFWAHSGFSPTWSE